MTDEKATEKQIDFAQKLGISKPWDCSKAELKELIAEKLADKEDAKPEVIRPGYAKTQVNGQMAMYVSYVKDLVIAGKPIAEAISIVHQAITAFDY